MAELCATCETVKTGIPQNSNDDERILPCAGYRKNRRHACSQNILEVKFFICFLHVNRMEDTSQVGMGEFACSLMLSYALHTM